MQKLHHIIGRKPIKYGEKHLKLYVKGYKYPYLDEIIRKHI
jgi:hypothetical protein